MNANDLIIITQNFDCPLHINPEFEVILVHHGTIKINREGTSETLGAHQAAIVLPYHLHGFEPLEDVEATVLLFPFSIAEKEYKSLCSKSYASYGLTLDECGYNYVQSALASYVQNRDEFVLKSLFYCFFSYFSLQNAPVSDKNADTKYIRKIMEFIYSNLDKELSLADISLATGVSRSKIGDTFNIHFGISLAKFINNLRLEKAKSLLTNSDLSITQISYDCGFGSLRSFNRIFYKKLGCTPSDFKKNNKARLG